MSDDRFDRDSWERRWAQALTEHGDKVAKMPPNAHLLAEVGDLPPAAPSTPAAGTVPRRSGWPPPGGR